jgi:archaellum biogenesis ATPase FlaH
MNNITKITPLHVLPAKNTQTKPTENATFSLSEFSLNGKSAVMREKMLNDTFVLDGIAILGQATAIYAKPNTGKTLIVLSMLIESIKAKRIKGDDVYYINADDTYKGLVTKLEIAEQYGFHMIAPSHGGFETNQFQSYVRKMIDENTAHGKVIILDTVKKFTDLMDKKQATNFMKIGREFISSGGTLIMLAHTNKNRDADGKVVFAGTSDVVDDCDCAYILDEVTKNDYTKQVLFENFKSRGDVVRELSFSYSITEKQSYKDLIDSVQTVDAATIQQAKKEKIITAKVEKDAVAIEVITDAINQGHNKQPDLLRYAKEAGVSDAKCRKALKDYEGEKLSNSSFWRVVHGEKNAKSYYLLTNSDNSARYYESAKNG